MSSELKICYHCDSVCEDELRHEEKSFCCQGCVTVYSILSENDLGNFYKLNDRPGVRIDSKKATRFDFLELEEVEQRLLRFRENGVARVKLFLPQIHCSSCLWLLERLNKIHPGVINCQVFFAEKEAEITFDEAEISLKELAMLLQSIGYEPKISQAELSDTGSVKKDYSRILKIGVTGFCFGNIMLLSFPEYLGINANDLEFQSTFNYLNILFSLPVLIYGAREYFASSFKTIRARGINIDVPITLGIIALYTRSLFEIISGSGAGYLDSFAGLIFFLLIGKWFQQKTYSAISFERDFKSYFPIASARIEENKEELVSLEKINKGDQLVIRNNELIPADAILVSGVGHIDYSFVTGESTPISKRIGERLFAGGRQSGSTIQIEVVRAVENSYLTRLWNNPIFHKKLPQGSLVDRVSKIFTFAVIGIALLAGIIWSQIDASRVVFVVTSVLIVACPCALALSVPFTYGNVIRLLGRKALFLRSTEVIEPLSKVTDIVFDKTGTLTEANQSEIQWEGVQLSDIQLDSIHHISNQSAHPLSRLIARHVVPSHNINMVTRVKEMQGLGLEGEIEGIKWRIGSASWLGQKDSVKETSVYVEENGVVLGRFKMTNVYRSELDSLLHELKDTYEMHVLSGDNDSEVHQLGTLFGKGAVLRFEQTPQDKLDYIRQLQKNGRVVLMLGDGLNDAGALKQADVGMAVADDVYAFTPASDAIIEGGRLTKLKAYLDFSKYGIRVVRLSYIFSILYNLVGLAFALSGHLTPLVAAILMPLSSISIVLLVTLLTNLKVRQFQ